MRLLVQPTQPDIPGIPLIGGPAEAALPCVTNLADALNQAYNCDNATSLLPGAPPSPGNTTSPSSPQQVSLCSLCCSASYTLTDQLRARVRACVRACVRMTAAAAASISLCIIIPLCSSTCTSSWCCWLHCTSAASITAEAGAGRLDQHSSKRSPHVRLWWPCCISKTSLSQLQSVTAPRLHMQMKS